MDTVWNPRVPCTRDHLEQGDRLPHLEGPDVLLDGGWEGNGGLAASVYRGLAYLTRQLSR